MTQKQAQKRCGAVVSQQHMDQRQALNNLATRSAGNADKVYRGESVKGAGGTADRRSTEPGCLQCPNEGLTDAERMAEDMGATFEAAAKQRDALSKVHAIISDAGPNGLTAGVQVKVFNLLLSTAPFGDHFKAELAKTHLGYELVYTGMETSEDAKKAIDDGAFGGFWPQLHTWYLQDFEVPAFIAVSGGETTVALNPANQKLYTSDGFNLLVATAFKLVPEARAEVAELTHGLDRAAKALMLLASFKDAAKRPGIHGTVQAIADLLQIKYALAEKVAQSARDVLGVILDKLSEPKFTPVRGTGIVLK